MTKNLTVSLEALVRRLGSPANYYAGRRAELGPLPDDLLMFSRTGTQLGPTPTSHHRFVLITPIRGAGTVAVDERAFRVTPGSALLVFPFQFHHYGDVDRRLTWLLTTFELPYETPIVDLRNSVRTLTADAVRDLESSVAAYLRKDATDELRLRVALVLRGLVLSHAGRTRPAVGNAELMQKVARVVFAHMAEPVPVPRIASRLGSSESHLRAKFRAQYGLGVHEYVRRLKMLQAMRLLRTTPSKIAEIGEGLGYASLFSFSRSFKDETGLSPRAYRKKEG
jgi:AraC-like DNA-binding protein